jgi:phosphoribosyl 1,2-cyclic phosphodiesterase/DNA-binding response OmpR family regulator
MNPAVRLQFWGTRGSLAKPGQKMIRYGGNTSCVQVTSPGGSLLVIDCGTGAHDLGQSLIAHAGEPVRGSILISHTHWDHIQGFPFFAPLFVRGSQWDIYGPRGLGQSLQDALAGQMQYTYFPLTLEELGATIRFHDLVEGTFEIDDIRITTRYLNHPALTLGYRLEMGGSIVVYACDHEPNVRHPGVSEPVHELDRRHSEFLAGADLVIHDAQFTDAEYAGAKGWGHSPVEYVSEMGQMAGVKQMALSHHDPKRTDDELDQIVESVRADLRRKGSLMQIFAAADGQVVELRKGDVAGGAVLPPLSTAFPVAASATHQSSVIIGTADQKLAAMLAEATRPDGVRSAHAAEGEGALQMARAAPPDLVLMDDQLRGIDSLSVCKLLRADGDERLKNVPVVIVADHERTDQGLIAGVTGWLIKPFSTQFARSHIHAWILRSVCRWSRAAVPSDEDKRLAALRELGVLDTPPEDRFDRITRIAADLAGVPIVLVSLVDENRQWFKSCHGLDVSETSRELSFCAHAVVSREPLIVFDTLQDDRFADNPLVTSGPRIRFYAGFPIFHSKGSCVGTLCLIDTRPRQFSHNLIQRFQDLASIVQKELNSTLERAAE